MSPALTVEKSQTKPIPRESATPNLAKRLPVEANPPNFECKHIKVIPLSETFGAEIEGVDFSKPVPEDVFQEIYRAWAQYGIIVFRGTQLNDESHIDFSRRFGSELDTIKMFIDNKDSTRKLRTNHYELFDVSNLDADGNILKHDDRRYKYNKGNALWHIDSTFNARRASYSLLLAHELPPRGTGGETDFADVRTAYDDLPQDMKEKLEPLIVEHSLWHSRKVANPEYEASDFEKNIKPPVRHDLVQVHEPSGRKLLYIAAHCCECRRHGPRNRRTTTDLGPN